MLPAAQLTHDAAPGEGPAAAAYHADPYVADPGGTRVLAQADQPLRQHSKSVRTEVFGERRPPLVQID